MSSFIKPILYALSATCFVSMTTLAIPYLWKNFSQRSSCSRKRLLTIRKLKTVQQLINKIANRLEKMEKEAVVAKTEPALSSYYHFDSNGKKNPNKWDSYNVEEELKKADDDDKISISSPIKEKGATKLSKELDGLEFDLESILEFLDDIRGDEHICNLRKEMVVSITHLHFKKLDDIRSTLESIAACA